MSEKSTEEGRQEVNTNRNTVWALAVPAVGTVRVFFS